jgi:hypothetical protein
LRLGGLCVSPMLFTHIDSIAQKAI